MEVEQVQKYGGFLHPKVLSGKGLMVAEDVDGITDDDLLIWRRGAAPGLYLDAGLDEENGKVDLWLHVNYLGTSDAVVSVLWTQGVLSKVVRWEGLKMDVVWDNASVRGRGFGDPLTSDTWHSALVLELYLPRIFQVRDFEGQACLRILQYAIWKHLDPLDCVELICADMDDEHWISPQYHDRVSALLERLASPLSLTVGLPGVAPVAATAATDP